MQLKLFMYILLSLFLYKSECAELHAMHATSCNNQIIQEEQPSCPICFNVITATSLIVIYPCNGKDNHYVCKGCYDNLQGNINLQDKCSECMKSVASNLNAIKFSQHKDFLKSHCKKCLIFYPHTAEQSVTCTACRPAPVEIPVISENTQDLTTHVAKTISDNKSQQMKVSASSQNTQNLNPSLVTENFDKEETETWKSKLTTIAGEGSVAFVVALTARILYDKGLLQHERASERNSAWSTVAGACIASNRLLEYLQPNRKNNPATLSSSWLIGGVIGLVLPTLIKNTQTTPRK